MYLGVDYYPEHWPVEMMDEDMRRMREMGCNIIRIGEFAWQKMEPIEGQFDFSFFDQVIAKAKAHELKVMFGTPTATFPAWLAKTHPSILAQEMNGEVRVFGGRRQYCYNSRVYQQYTEKIVSKLVKHYANEPAIIAWQMDNEIGHEGSDQCYCEQCHLSFQDYLRDVYENDIGRLNEAYGTIFWGQTYTDFAQIPMPVHTVTTHNPALRLDWARFRSDSINAFAKMQIDLIKAHRGAHQQVTHNLFGGFFNRAYDQNVMAAELDFVSYDNYPVWGGLKEPLKPAEIAMTLDYIRGLKQQNFWIVEQLMGAQGHNHIGYLPRPKQAQLWAYQAMARGCDNMLFFRWRGMDRGAEQFCLGILDIDNETGRKYREVQEFMHDVAQQPSLSTPIHADVAVLYDYDNIQSWAIQQQSDVFDFTQELMRLYAPFHAANVMTDVISTAKDFSGYKVVVLPVMQIMDESLAQRLRAFVAGGGVLLMGYRSAIKNRQNNLHRFMPTPAFIHDLLGGRVRESESFGNGISAPVVAKGGYPRAVATVWRDMIEPSEGAQVLYHYDDKFYKDYACVTVNAYERGFVYWVGAGLDETTMSDVVGRVLEQAGIADKTVVDRLERIERGDGQNSMAWYLNHTSHPQTVEFRTIAPYSVLKRTLSDEP